MNTDTTYNGWTNYATWRVNLEICDDYLNSIVNDAHHGYIDKYNDVAELADHLKDYVDDALTNYGELTDGIALDYARSFVSDVDWYEIAEHWTDELIVQEEMEQSA
jgi:hypothetical protein